MNAAESAPCLSLPATHVAFDEIARQHAIAGTIAAREKLVRGTAAAGNESENAMANRSLAKGPSDTCVLVTGGAGFIGSHTCVELLNRGYRVVVLDDLSNSSEVALDRVRAITGVGDDRLAFYEASILDREALDRVFAENDIDAIIHFAGFKAVGESVQKPLEYYWNNVAGTLVLCEAARAAGCKNLVFSSSATVYGEPEFIPITEDCPKHEATNPYGQTKSMLEQVLTDLYVGDDEWNVVLLRYFNPIGAHESGLIGEDPKGIPNNLLPYVAQVAVGKLERVGVFGDDYPTPDGTGVRDYIHVVDLARGHVAALDWMGGKVGTGEAQRRWARWQAKRPATAPAAAWASSTWEPARARACSMWCMRSRSACGKELPYEMKPRRAGDIAENYAACDKARDELGWTAEYDLDRMCADSWRWQSQNPDGYATSAVTA